MTASGTTRKFVAGAMTSAAIGGRADAPSALPGRQRLTHICPDRCARVAMQHVSCLFLRARADRQKPGVRWRKYHVVDEVERRGFAEHLQMSR